MFSRTLPAAHEVSLSLDMFIYYHLSCLWKFSFGGIFQEDELIEQCLPLNFSVFTAHEQGEFELSCNEMTFLATGMAVISWKIPLSSFSLQSLQFIWDFYFGFWGVYSELVFWRVVETSFKLFFCLGLVFIKPGTVVFWSRIQLLLPQLI